MKRKKPTAKNALLRFWSKVGPPDENGCRRWLGWSTNRGYGMVRFQGRDVCAHGVAFCLAYPTWQGPHLSGPRVYRHTCDQSWCVEPSHAVPGTHAQNMDDMIVRGRQAKGARNGGSRLTRDAVLEIRSRLTAGEAQHSIARRYGVTRQNVYYINLRKTWAWL